jgi:hypothetical protein
LASNSSSLNTVSTGELRLTLLVRLQIEQREFIMWLLHAAPILPKICGIIGQMAAVDVTIYACRSCKSLLVRWAEALHRSS